MAKTDIIRRVFGDDTGEAWLEVRPWPEAPDSTVELASCGNKDWFDQFRVALDPSFARELGKALIAAADELSA